MHTVTIHGNAYDPADTSALGSLDSDAATKYVLVTISGRLLDREKELLKDAGCELLDIPGPNTYLCRCDPSRWQDVRELAFVEHVNAYRPTLKVQPQLWPRDFLSRDQSSSAEDASTIDDARDLRIMISLHAEPDQPAEAVMDYLITKGVLDKAHAVIIGDRIDAKVSSKENLGAIAVIDDVCAIEEHPVKKPQDEITRNLVNATAYYHPQPREPVKNDNEYLGRGQTIQFMDTGFDKGQRRGIHPGFHEAQLVGLYNPWYPVSPTADQLNDTYNHGTSVAGCAVLDYTSTTMGGPSCNGPGLVRGTAPAANFVSTKIWNDKNEVWEGSFADIIDPAYKQHDMRIINQSFAHSPPQKPYNATCTEIDDLLFSLPDLLFVQCAGNEGTLTKYSQQITGDAACKNLLTVGNSLTSRKMKKEKFDPSEESETDPYQMDNTSSRGPTYEHRIKPDVVAPGTVTLTSTTTANPPPPPATFGPTTDDKLRLQAGTSFSTPTVSGCAALLREALGKYGTPAPSSALMKALLVNGAVDISSVSKRFHTVPNGEIGFGRVNVASSLRSITDTMGRGGIVNSPTPLAPGSTSQPIRVVVPAPRPIVTGGDTCGSTLTVTLVWTDHGGAQLINQLGLGVTIPKVERRNGNKGDKNMLNSPDDYDNINNVQRVVWKDIPEGIALITVECVQTLKDPSVTYGLAWTLSE